jgi:hypothetical protein
MPTTDTWNVYDRWDRGAAILAVTLLTQMTGALRDDIEPTGALLPEPGGLAALLAGAIT